MKSIKSVVAVGLLAVMSTACMKTSPVELPFAQVAHTDTCFVSDREGRLWQWRSAGEPCKKALYDCRRYHGAKAGILYHGCKVIERLPDN